MVITVVIKKKSCSRRRLRSPGHLLPPPLDIRPPEDPAGWKVRHDRLLCTLPSAPGASVSANSRKRWTAPRDSGPSSSTSSPGHRPRPPSLLSRLLPDQLPCPQDDPCLHSWMQAWSDQGEKMLAIVEGTDKLDNNAIAFDCSDDEFRSIEASLDQALHRTRANEPLRIVQPTRGQRGFVAWHATVRRYDQRNMSDKKTAYAALIQ